MLLLAELGWSGEPRAMFTRANSKTVRNRTTDWNLEISTLWASDTFSLVSCLCLVFLLSACLAPLFNKLDIKTPAEFCFLFFCCFLRVIFRIEQHGVSVRAAMSQVCQLSQGMFDCGVAEAGVNKIAKTCFLALQHSSLTPWEEEEFFITKLSQLYLMLFMIRIEKAAYWWRWEEN